MRSCRLSRKVKMSDCHSWFGSALSKRRGPGSGLATFAGVSSKFASCSIRRTSVSLIGSASKRLSTSRIRRVPYSGFAFFSAITASPLGSSAAGFAFAGPGVFGNSASKPPFSYACRHSCTVVAAKPNALHTSLSPAPAFNCCSTCTFTSNGCVLRFDAACFGFDGLMSSPFGKP